MKAIFKKIFTLALIFSFVLNLFLANPFALQKAYASESKISDLDV